jgi:hypothetical protein
MNYSENQVRPMSFFTPHSVSIRLRSPADTWIKALRECCLLFLTAQKRLILRPDFELLFLNMKIVS